MIWFRITLVILMACVFVFAIGEATGILVMITRGTDLQSMELDPAKNGTLPIYVFILMFLFFLMVSCVFGCFICFLTYRNKFQMDLKIRHYFIIWVGCWVGGIFSNMGIAIYALVRNKDPQGQMGFMFEMFQKMAQNGKFIASFEKFQRENACCGIYGPDDWLMVQLRSSPGGSGALQSFDYGFQQNPSTGKCHLVPPTIPPGCGQKMMMAVNIVLNLYAALSMVLIVIAAATGIIAWYCFFYWLDKEVIVIPEDEVSNIIIVEPEPSDTSQYSGRPSEYYPSVRSANYLRHGDYMDHSRVSHLPPGSYIRHGTSIFPASIRNSQRQPSGRTVVYTRPSGHPTHSNYPAYENPQHSRQTNYEHSRQTNYRGEQSRHTNYEHSRQTNYGGERSRVYPTASRIHEEHRTRVISRTELYLNPSSFGHAHAGSYLGPPVNHASQRLDEPYHHETTLEKQEHILGGKLLGEMHVDHDLDKGKDLTSQRAQGSSKHQAHHATIAIVRNKHKNDAPPKTMQHHGHTGHLAEDIAEMSGRNAVPKVEDVIIPVPGAHHHHPPRKQVSKTPVVSLGSVTGNKAQNAVEDLLEPQHLKKQKKAHEKQVHPEKDDLVHAHYLPGLTPPGSSTYPGMAGSQVRRPSHNHGAHSPEHHQGGYFGPGHPVEHNPGHGHHDHYLNDGGHHQEHDHHDHYLNDGGHHQEYDHHNRYLNDGGHHQEHGHHDHYLNDGGHHQQHGHGSRAGHNAHHPTVPFLGPPPGFDSPNHEHHHESRRSSRVPHHHEDRSHHQNHSNHMRHIDPGYGSHPRREDRRSASRDRSRRSQNTTIIFKNPHGLEDSD